MRMKVHAVWLPVMAHYKKNMRKLFAIIFVFLSTTLIGQLNKKSIDNNFCIGKNTIYIVNGLPYEQSDSMKLDSALCSYPQEHIIEIRKLTTDNSTVFCLNNEVAVIYFATQQSKKVIKTELKKIKKLIYKIKKNKSAKPALIVNNTNINEKEFQLAIKSLKINNIYYIEYKTGQQNTTVFGERGRNGLIRIITKDSESSHI